MTVATARETGHGSRSYLLGWLEALLYAIGIGITGIAYVIAIQWGAHIAVFMLASMVISASALVAVTGLDPDWRGILGHPMTWFVGTTHILMESTYFLMMLWLAPAEASLLTRFSMPIALIVGWLVLARLPSRLGLLGIAISTCAVVGFAAVLDLSLQWPGVALAVLAGLLIVMRGFASEFHPHNRAARTVLEKVRVTGHVILVTSIAGIALTGTLMLAIAAGVLAPTPLVPSPAQVLHLPTLALAALVGAGLFAGMVYLMFSSTVKITAENFIATGAVMPVATLLVQMAAERAGLISAPPFDWRLAPAMAGLMAGVVVIVLAAGRARRRPDS